MATDLHTRLVEAITARLNLAEAALADRASGWWWGPDAESAAERHIAANSPAFVAGACRADLARLRRHRPTDRDAWRYGITCDGCPNSAVSWPCVEIQDVAGVYGVNLDEQEG